MNGPAGQRMLPVFTIGYEGRTINDFLVDLKANDIKLLADVREAPISRKRGFSKSALASALQDAGIDYLHVRALGCPKAIRDAHRADHDWQRYTRDYLDHLARQEADLAALDVHARQQRTALLCFEADFTRCHRTYVAHALQALAPREVLHITQGALEPGHAQP